MTFRLRIRLLLLTVFIIFFQQLVDAQINTQKEYLNKVGVLDSIYSTILTESREIYIQIPENYNPETNQKYPVVFILDGELFLPSVWDVLNYYSGGFMPEMVLVGISNAKNRQLEIS